MTAESHVAWGQASRFEIQLENGLTPVSKMEA
jgi:hypothetical protein